MITIFGILCEITEKLFIQTRFFDHHRIAKILIYRIGSEKIFNTTLKRIFPKLNAF
jgi:hypothetical protein